MSLRLRLLIGILALAAVGLLVLDVVSYKVLAGHLDERADQQVEAAARPLGVALRSKADPEFRPPSGGFPGSPAATPQNESGPREIPPDELPPGTFGQLRSTTGEVLATASFDYGDEELARPDLSGDLPVTPFGDVVQTKTVDAKQGDSQFRVGAVSGPDGLVTVAAIPLGDNEETLAQLALIETVVTVSVLLALAASAWWVIGVGLGPLRRMGETANEIAEGDLTRRVEDTNPRTEVGRLGIALNSMLGQIEESFRRREESESRMRHFLADASHELRTPLVSIRGYSELYRLGAIQGQEELEAAMRRIESESQRMGSLVDDLLALARLDEMPTPIDSQEVELGQILNELVEDLRAIGSEREITFETTGDLTVNGDSEQLRRAIRNVLRNAVTHTGEGTPVEVSAIKVGDEVQIRVRDHGSGIPPGAETEVFQRFWRASESRGRDDGGAGIGLALVAAIVQSHGGSVTASNAVGGGAEFLLLLPAA